LRNSSQIPRQFSAMVTTFRRIPKHFQQPSRRQPWVRENE
jgi:hypothetical protein